MSWFEIVLVIVFISMMYKHAFFADTIMNVVAFFYLWFLEPVFDFFFCGMLYLFGERLHWQVLVAPRFRRLGESITTGYAKLRGKRRAKRSPLISPSRTTRFLYAMCLMSYDELITYERAMNPYRSGGPLGRIVHHPSPLERVVGVGFWPFT